MIQTLSFILFIVILVAATVGGYAGFLVFLTRVMPEVSAFGLALVALIAGVAGFFNPCAFPLLPAYLGGFYLEKRDLPLEPKDIFRSGLAATLGVITFNILLGIALALLGAGFGASFGITTATPNPYVRWLRGLVGVFLTYLGWSHAAGRGNPFVFLGHLVQPRIAGEQEASGFKKFYSYGFGYTLLGIGCGGPILGSLAIFALSTGGLQSVLLSFAIYTLTMAVLMAFVSLLIGFSREVLISRLRASIGVIQRVSGTLILLVGMYLILSSVFVQEFARILFP